MEGEGEGGGKGVGRGVGRGEGGGNVSRVVTTIHKGGLKP
jgi:hypothetical protein